MQLHVLNAKKEKAEFLKFHAALYKGDPSYVCMENFVLQDVLFQQTDFAKTCVVQPVAVKSDGKILAQAILIYASKLPLIQVGFFDALRNQKGAVALILSQARALKAQYGAKGIVVGLNGHISYGVGILTEGFAHKNSFDSIYNKDYYADYFALGRRQGLSTYKAAICDALPRFPKIDASGVRIRKCNLKSYKREMETMRALCEQTIAKTDLYFPTDEGHFYQLTSALQPFLRAENLLFAEDAKGNPIGFLFYHPDFNQTLKGGKEYSLLGMVFAMLTQKKQIDTVKINAIGSLSPRATNALLQEFCALNKDKYDFLETTFIWDNNLQSSLLAKRVLGDAHRKYEVYYFDES